MIEVKNKEKFNKWLLLIFYGGNKKKYDRFFNYDFEEQIGVHLSYLRDEFQVVLCIYTNASGFLWGVQNVGGTDLGWSGVGGGDCENSGCWKTFESAAKNAIGLITKCSFNEYHKCEEFTHCGNYADYLKTL